MSIFYDEDFIKAAKWSINQVSFNGTVPFILLFKFNSEKANKIYQELIAYKIVRKEGALTKPNMTLSEFEVLLQAYRKEDDISKIVHKPQKEIDDIVNSILRTNGFSKIRKQSVLFDYVAKKDEKIYGVYLVEDDEDTYNAILSSHIIQKAFRVDNIIIMAEHFREDKMILANCFNFQLFDISSMQFIKQTYSHSSLFNVLKKDLNKIDLQKRILNTIFKNEGFEVNCLPVAIKKTSSIFFLTNISISNVQEVYSKVIKELLCETNKYANTTLQLEEGHVYLFLDFNVLKTD